MGRVNSPKAGSSTSTAGKATGDKSPRSSNEKTASSDTSPQECHPSESPANTTTSAKKGTPTTAGQNQPPDKPAPGQSATRAAESNSPVRRQDTGRAGPEHPRAGKPGPVRPRVLETTGLPGAGGWLRSVSNFPDQPLPKSRRGWSGTTTTLHHPPKNKKSRSKSKSKSKPISGAGAAERAGYPGQWCRSSRTRRLNRAVVETIACSRG